MKSPSNITDVKLIDWDSPDARRLTLKSLHAWEEAASQHRVVEPTPDEEVWEGTEIDVRRTVL